MTMWSGWSVKMVTELPDTKETGVMDAECLLTVTGDIALLNTFDKAFRSGFGPQWADRPGSPVPRYSLHALFPVPEDVLRRGFSVAGRLWCESYWETEGDLRAMQVKRVLGERRYHFFVPGNPPVNFFRVVSRTYSNLEFRLSTFGRDEESWFGKFEDALHQYLFEGGAYTGSHSRETKHAFAHLMKEMGFQS